MGKYGEYLLFILVLASCSSNDYKENIAEYLNTTQGVDLNYKSIEFRMIDTIYQHELVDSLNKRLSILKQDIAFDDLTKDEMLKLRNQDEIWSGNDTYIEMIVLSGDYDSPYIRELRKEILKTDSLLQYYPWDITNKALLLNWQWYIKKRANYYSNPIIKDNYNRLSANIDTCIVIINQLDYLINEDSEDIIHLIAYNRYKIVNPFLNNAKQTLEAVFKFNKDGEVIDHLFLN